MSEPALLKDSIDLKAIKSVANNIATVYSEFDKTRFVRLAKINLEANELKQRVKQIIDALQATLPEKFDQSSKILLNLARRWETKPDTQVSMFAAWPVIDYVAVVGKAQPEKALRVLEKLTPFFSAEFAIRTFYKDHEDLTLKTAKNWCVHRNEHVRRLASEGLRPRLPWAPQLRNFVEDPQRVLPILDALKTDDSLYVRRSVANCLNDISKDHPDLVISTCQQWLDQNDQLAEDKKKDLLWVVRHATRSLVKQGTPAVFALQGYTPKPKIELNHLRLSAKKVAFGGEITFSVEVESTRPQQHFVMDYCVYYKKQNGQLSPKVFKLKNCLLDKGERICCEKTLNFRPLTTRKYYAGEHILAIHINGVELGKVDFRLVN